MQLSIFISPATAEFLPFLRELVGLNGLGPSELICDSLRSRKSVRFTFPLLLVIYPLPLRELVGLNGLGPSTSRLSGVCSNQLSYEPLDTV